MSNEKVYNPGILQKTKFLVCLVIFFRPFGFDHIFQISATIFLTDMQTVVNK